MLADTYECDIQKTKYNKTDKNKPTEYNYTILYGVFITIIDIYFIYKIKTYELTKFIYLFIIFIFLIIIAGLCFIVTIIYYDIKNTKGQIGEKTINKISKNVNSIKKNYLSKLILYGYFILLSSFNVLYFGYKMNDKNKQ
jgi:hypothetical protein